MWQRLLGLNICSSLLPGTRWHCPDLPLLPCTACGHTIEFWPMAYKWKKCLLPLGPPNHGLQTCTVQASAPLCQATGYRAGRCRVLWPWSACGTSTNSYRNTEVSTTDSSPTGVWIAHISEPKKFKPMLFRGQLFPSAIGNPWMRRANYSYVFAESKVIRRFSTA